MIGNDIIDLEVAALQSNWQRQGFLTKLFSEKERAVIVNSENSFQTVWLLWSMKESAYKVYAQKYHKRFFAPKKFECTLSSATTGLVSIATERYATKSTMSGAYIFTEAILCNNHIREQHYFEIVPNFSKNEVLYMQLKRHISRSLAIPFNKLNIRKNALGIPKLYCQNEHLNLSVSFTHHGNFGAFSIFNTPT